MHPLLKHHIPGARARLVRLLEWASDDPLLDPDARRRAERHLFRLKAILRERMARLDPCRRTFPISLARVRGWTGITCSCGAHCDLLVEGNHHSLDLVPLVAVKVVGPFALGAGDPVCLRCWSGADPHPTVQ